MSVLLADEIESIRWEVGMEENGHTINDIQQPRKRNSLFPFLLSLLIRLLNRLRQIDNIPIVIGLFVGRPRWWILLIFSGRLTDKTCGVDIFKQNDTPSWQIRK